MMRPRGAFFAPDRFGARHPDRDDFSGSLFLLFGVASSAATLFCRGEMLRSRAFTLALSMVTLSASVARAGSPEITRAVNFLFSVQDPQGSFSSNRGALVVRDTAEVLSALDALGSGSDTHALAAASFLRISNVETADFQARVVAALRNDPLIATSSGTLLAAQLADGGFSLS